MSLIWFDAMKSSVRTSMEIAVVASVLARFSAVTMISSSWLDLLYLLRDRGLRRRTSHPTAAANAAISGKRNPLVFTTFPPRFATRIRTARSTRWTPANRVVASVRILGEQDSSAAGSGRLGATRCTRGRSIVQVAAPWCPA